MGKDTIADRRTTLARVSLALNAKNAPGRNLPPLILLTDDQRDADYAEAVRALPKGAAVIIRHRDTAKRERLAATLADVARPLGIRCLIANDLTLAERLDVDGIHASEASIGEISEWRRRHPRWLITAAIHATTPVATLSADALLFGSVFATRSHPQGMPVGVAAFDGIAARSNKPVYALGGITADNVHELAATHAAGIALIGGWLRS